MPRQTLWCAFEHFLGGSDKLYRRRHLLQSEGENQGVQETKAPGYRLMDSTPSG